MVIQSIIGFLFIISPLISNPDFPNFAIYDLEGNRHVFYQILKEMPPNTKIILNFTSINCKPCEKEIPELIDLEQKKSNVRLYCIFAETIEIVKPKAKKLELHKAYSDPMENIQRIFGIKEYPTTIVISANGKKLSTFVSYNEKQMKALKKLLGVD